MCHLLGGIFDDALGLLEERQLGVNHNLLEQPHVLRPRVVVDAVDEGQPKVPAQTTEEAIRQARHGRNTAVTGDATHVIGAH